jgi:hypothetical protein
MQYPILLFSSDTTALRDAYNWDTVADRVRSEIAQYT